MTFNYNYLYPESNYDSSVSVFGDDQSPRFEPSTWSYHGDNYNNIPIPTVRGHSLSRVELEYNDNQAKSDFNRSISHQYYDTSYKHNPTKMSEVHLDLNRGRIHSRNQSVSSRNNFREKSTEYIKRINSNETNKSKYSSRTSDEFNEFSKLHASQNYRFTPQEDKSMKSPRKHSSVQNQSDRFINHQNIQNKRKGENSFITGYSKQHSRRNNCEEYSNDISKTTIKNAKYHDKYLPDYEYINDPKRKECKKDHLRKLPSDPKNRNSAQEQTRKIAEAFMNHGARRPTDFNEKNTQNTVEPEDETSWFLWSQKRRDSFMKRTSMATALQKDELHISTPVIRARQESRDLLAPELVTLYLPHEKLIQHHKKERKRIVPEKKKSKGGRQKVTMPSSLIAVHIKPLSPESLRLLISYWEHDIFVRARSWALCFAFIGIALCSFVTTSSVWIHYGDIDHPNSAGLWVVCYPHNHTGCLPTILKYHKTSTWQRAVLSLLLFTILSAVVATIFSFGAVCVSDLAKRMYYYHSAGEIYFVSSFTCTLSMLFYPTSIEGIVGRHQYVFGYAYYVGWLVCAIFLLAAFTMMLDELIRESTKSITCCSCCFRKRRARRAAMRARTKEIVAASFHRV